jgi:hypothetical protein
VGRSLGRRSAASGRPASRFPLAFSCGLLAEIESSGGLAVSYRFELLLALRASRLVRWPFAGILAVYAVEPVPRPRRQETHACLCLLL